MSVCACVSVCVLAVAVPASSGCPCVVSSVLLDLKHDWLSAVHCCYLDASS